MDTILRQWCDQCQQITQSWLDTLGYLRCSHCDPESALRPGHAARNYSFGGS